ncbi:uncharacterized protein isoform X2 [Choristoneura fumiferana]|uniref:uncharacterized protein isoform X2 n=1 Tax=Choristoneura fumiferana TaxID=7141 RepID=UPI003D158853
MNELLQKHGCSNVFTVPEGLRELMSDISREVLRDQPEKIYHYIANYLSVLLITREHGIMAVNVLDDLCDCRQSVSEHLLQLGLERSEAKTVAEVIQEELQNVEPEEGKEKVKEIQILKKILTRCVMDEEKTAKVTQVARNAYRDYWYRKQLLQESLKETEEPWEVAAQRTLNIYKRTKPSFDELTRATQKIQAAYRGYYVRRNMLRHLKTKSGPKLELPGPPVDVADSREIDLGRVIDIKVKDDNVGVMFDTNVSDNLGLPYDPMRTITHVEKFFAGQPHSAKSSEFGKSSQAASKEEPTSRQSRLPSELPSRSSVAPRSRMPSQADPDSRQSRLPSQIPSGAQSLKFATEPEILGSEEYEDTVQEAQGLQPAQDSEPVSDTPGDAAEVPEDLTERSEGDGTSAPISSTADTAPDTTDATDVEDALNTTGETEGP